LFVVCGSSYADYKRFVKISGGSVFETKHWAKKAFKRNMINEKDNIFIIKIIEELIPRISAFIIYLSKMCN